MIRWRTLFLLVLAFAGVASSATVQAQDEDALLKTRIEHVIAVLQGSRQAAETFDERFLAAVPPDQLRGLAAKLTAQGGAVEGYADFQREQANAATFTLRLANATAPARIELDPAAPALVSGFRIFGLTPGGDSLARLDTAFAALAGTSGFAIYKLGDGAPTLVQGRNPDTAFAIGSTFKLYILAALARQVQDGQRHWADVVPVSAKSFPGGTIHTLPDGAPVTLHTLASLMIAISDNTATDMLVRLVGQEALAREVKLAGHARPNDLAPMLTTAQFFALKLAGPEAAARYAAAPPAERERQLAALDLGAVADTDPGRLGHVPNAIGQIEWFASPADLARAMDDLRRLGSREALDILAINPAMDVVTARTWDYVGYKGGSEAGVMSMTWLLRDKAGAWYTVSGSWNDPAAAIDEDRFAMLMLRLAKLAGK